MISVASLMLIPTTVNPVKQTWGLQAMHVQPLPWTGIPSPHYREFGIILHLLPDKDFDF